MLAELRPALIITRREIRDQFRDWRIIIPILVLTVLFPSLMNFTAHQAANFVQRYGATAVGDRLMPFLLMVVGFFPISVSLVIALESFVGEKERHSIEPLLCSPLSDWQLYLGKLLAATVPPLIASYIGIGVYLIGLYRKIGWTPEPDLLVQILLLTTVQAVVMVSGAVVVSSQTTSVRAANLLASFIIIPMTFLIQGESVVMFWANYDVLWWAIIGQIVVAALLIRTGVSKFNREELLGRELDVINLRWGISTFWRAFIGHATSPFDWYQKEVFPTLRRLNMPLGLIAATLAVGMVVGAGQARVFVLPADALQLENLGKGFVTGLEAIRFFSVENVSAVWLHNLRVMMLATVLGIFSFGVLGILVLMVPMMLIGYFTGAVAGAGISPWLFMLAFVVPHGILEVPAIILVGAAILRLGGTLAAPSPGKTIGEAWLQAFGDWTKVIVGLVLPLLFGAALLEVFVTPKLVPLIFGGR
ncbi:MAG TPA: stage II sporulation protein M [Anaerolineales bacterium]